MLNDLAVARNNALTSKYVASAKQLFGEEVPYRYHKSALGVDSEVIIFSDVFITHMRAVLSNVNGPALTHMSKKEQRLFYLYVQYVDTGIVSDSRMTQVVKTLDKYITNELGCVEETYTNQAFNTSVNWTEVAEVPHTWETCLRL